MAAIHDTNKREDDLQATSWQAELTFRDWKAGLEGARANWASAPANLKNTLLLEGTDLVTATSWMISRPSDLSPQQQSFIRKSIAHSYNSAAEEHRHLDAQRKTQLKSWISFGATISAFVLFLGLELALYDLWVKATGAMYVSEAPPQQTFATPKLPTPMAAGAQTVAATTAGAQVSPSVSAGTYPSGLEPAALTPFAERSVSAKSLAERSLAAARGGDPVRAQLIALEALADANLRLPIEDELIPALTALQHTLKSVRTLAVDPMDLDTTQASISRDGANALLIASDRSARWASLTAGKQNSNTARNVVQSGQAIVGLDDALVAVSGGDEGVRLWPAGASQPVAILRGHEAGMTGLAMSRDKMQVATTSWDESVRIWDIRSGRNQWILRGHEAPPLTAAFNAGGDRLVTASEDRTARIWSTVDGRTVAVLRGHLSTVQSAVFDATGRRVLTTSLDGTARIWDAGSGQETAVLRMASNPLFSAAFSTTSRRVVTVSSRGDLAIWSADDGRPIASYPRAGYAVQSYVLGDEDALLMVLTTEGSILVRAADTGAHAGLYGASPGDKIVAATFAADGKSILAITARQQMLMWPIIRSAQDLVAQVRAMAPRCLSLAERAELQLDPVIPRWCTDQAKALAGPL